MPIPEKEKKFHLYGWGDVYYSSLWSFVPFPGKKLPGELEINETTEGRFTNPTSDKKPERLTRIG